MILSLSKIITRNYPTTHVLQYTTVYRANGLHWIQEWIIVAINDKRNCIFLWQNILSFRSHQLLFLFPDEITEPEKLKSFFCLPGQVHLTVVCGLLLPPAVWEPATGSCTVATASFHVQSPQKCKKKHTQFEQKIICFLFTVVIYTKSAASLVHRQVSLCFGNPHYFKLE